MIKIFLIHFFAMLLAQTSFAHVRNVYPKNDEIILVKTSIAIATLIQFPDSTSVQMPIIGDQSGFRIEPLDKGITIKPLRFAAKTNLYLFTDKKRYNFKLITTAQDQADYILYIKNTDVSQSLQWKILNKTVSFQYLKLVVNKITQTKDQMILIDATLKSKESLPISSDDFWIYQGKESKTIHSLYISDKRVSENLTLLIGLAISKSDLKEGKPIQLVFKNNQKHLTVDISSEVLWK